MFVKVVKFSALRSTISLQSSYLNLAIKLLISTNKQSQVEPRIQFKTVAVSLCPVKLLDLMLFESFFFLGAKCITILRRK